MKKLFSLSVFLLCAVLVQAQYNPSNFTVSNKSYGMAQAGPTDARSYFYDASLFIMRPYQSTAEACSYLNLVKYRKGSFPVYINTGALQSDGTFIEGTILEYWFKNGTANADLVLKQVAESDPKRVTGIAITGTTTKTVTLTLADATTVTGSFTDLSADSTTYATNYDVDSAKANLRAATALREASANKGVANGYAPLNGATKIDPTYLPTGSTTYKGTWDASANSPTLADGTGSAGWTYTVSTAGTKNLGSGSITWAVGDQAIHNGTIYQRSPSGSAVASVNGKTGTVVVDKTDVGLSNVDNTPDASKPISTATATALAGKADQSALIDTAVAIRAAFPAAVDTSVLGTRLTNNTNTTNGNVATLQTSVNGKASQSALIDSSAAIRSAFPDVSIYKTKTASAADTTTLGSNARALVNATNTAVAGKENSLGNPASNGYVLSSTTGGGRSWVPPGSGISALTGDVSASGTGSVAATLAPTGTAGTYTKVTTDTKGRVTSGATLAVADLPTTTTYPGEATYGTIYNKQSWTDLSDFLPNSAGTSTVALSSNFINVASTSVSWSNWIKIMPLRPTMLPKWSMEIIFKVTAISSSSTGFGLGLTSVNSSGDLKGCMAYVNTTSGGSSGALSINKQDGTILTSSAGTAIALNDIVRLTLTFSDSSMTFSTKNITSNAATTNLTYNWTVNGSNTLPNSSDFAMLDFAGASPGIHQVQSIKITSATTKNQNLLVVGDSKTQGYFVNYFNGRFGWKLNSNYPNSVIWAGGSDQTADVLLRMQELQALNPQQVLMSIGSNDIRYSSLQTAINNYQAIVSGLSSGGTKVLHMVFPEDSTAGGVGLTAFKNWVAATYPSTYINTWDALVTSSTNIMNPLYKSSDGVHVNQAGNDIIYSTVVSSGLISTIDPTRKSQFRTTDENIAMHGDSLYLAFKISKQVNAIPSWDAYGNLKTGLTKDDGSTFIVSTLPSTSKVSGSIATIAGQLGITGASGGITYAYRDGSQTASAWATYANGSALRFFQNNRGSDALTIDSTGRIAINNNSARFGGGFITASAYLTLPAGAALAGFAPLKITAGVKLATPEAGAVEFDGTDYWVTTGTTRLLLTRTLTGTAAPATTPSAVGIHYVDTTNKKEYVATGTASSADWTILN